MNYNVETLKMFSRYANFNTLTQADGDTGDSAQRIGTFFSLCRMAGNKPENIAKYANLEYNSSMKAHSVPGESGVYIRSPDIRHWGNNPDNFSRDQWQAVQLAFAVMGDTTRLLASFKALASRLFLHQNVREGTDGNKEKFPDVAHPTHFSVLIRGLNLWFLWPLLVLLDLTFLGDLILRKKATDYDNMLAPQLLYANVKYVTPIAWLAMKMYVRTDWVKQLELYHSVERNGILPFPALFWSAYQFNKFIKE